MLRRQKQKAYYLMPRKLHQPKKGTRTKPERFHPHQKSQSRNPPRETENHPLRRERRRTTREKATLLPRGLNHPLAKKGSNRLLKSRRMTTHRLTKEVKRVK